MLAEALDLGGAEGAAGTTLAGATGGETAKVGNGSFFS
jgi:hypothetical protein